jgi:hypothetical protein
MSQDIRRMSKADFDRMNETIRAYRQGQHQPEVAVEHAAPDLREESFSPLPDAVGVQLDLL